MIENTGTNESAHRFSLGNVEIDVLNNTLVKDSIEYSLEPRLMRIINRLARSHGEIVTRSELLKEISEQGFVSDESLTQAMSKIRQVFGDDRRKPRFIKTVPKKGYLLLPPAIPIKGTPSNSVAEQQDADSLVSNKKSYWPQDKARAIIYASVLIICMVILSLIFWPKEQQFIEEGEIEFIEKGETELIEKED